MSAIALGIGLLALAALSSGENVNPGGTGEADTGLPTASGVEAATNALRTAVDLPAWVRVALEQFGTAEQAGTASNPRISDYHRAVDGTASPDDVPWCASFVNWVFAQIGVKGTGSRAARSFLSWGASTDPRFGAVAVLRRGTSPTAGHVGILVASSPDHRTIYLLGGNQGDRVNVSGFPASDVIGYRWPGGVA